MAESACDRTIWDADARMGPRTGDRPVGRGLRLRQRAVGEPGCRGGRTPGQTARPPPRQIKGQPYARLGRPGSIDSVPFRASRQSSTRSISPAKPGLRRGGITRPTRRHVLMALFSTPPSYDISRVTRHLAGTVRMVNCALHNGKRGCHFLGFATHSGQAGRPSRPRAASRAGPATRSPSAQAHRSASSSGLPSRRLLWAPHRRPGRHGHPTPPP